MRLAKWLAAICATAMITACGGDDNSETSAQQSIGTGEFNAHTYLVSESDAAGSLLTADTFTVLKPQATIYKIGDVLVVDAHGGRLMRVIGVRETDSEIHYQYEQASLAQAFKRLDIHMHGALTAEDLGDLSDQQDDPEIALDWVPSTLKSGASSATEQDKDKIEAATDQVRISYKKLGFQAGDGITIDGYTSFSLNPDFFIRLSGTDDQEIPEREGAPMEDAPSDTNNQATPELEFSAKISPDLETSVTIGSKYAGRVSYTFNKTHEFQPVRRTIIVLVPVLGVPVPVPFWFQPIAKFSGSIRGTASSSFSATQNYDVGGEFGFSRTRGSGFDAVANISPRASMEVSDVESEFGVTVAAPKVELYFKIYSAAGPFFDLGLESSLTGKNSVQGTPPVEGVAVEGKAAIVANTGLKAFDFGNILGVENLLGHVSFEYRPISIKVYSKNLLKWTHFFPYARRASIVINDNGRIADDIFAVALDGTVLGRTRKGGSGQFRLKNLRPGARTLALTTVEDDSPPGTYEITLFDGLTFLGGSTHRRGTLPLGKSANFTVLVPELPADTP